MNLFDQEEIIKHLMDCTCHEECCDCKDYYNCDLLDIESLAREIDEVMVKKSKYLLEYFIKNNFKESLSIVEEYKDKYLDITQIGEVSEIGPNNEYK